MMNLIRMDFKRLQKSKSTYVILGVVVLFLLVQFMAVYVALNPDIQAWLSAHGIVFTVSGLEQMKSLSLLQFFHLTMTQNFYALIIGVFVVLFNCYEYETGFIKNILSVHVKKAHYICSKIIIQSLYVLGLLLIIYLEFFILNIAVGSFFEVDRFLDSFTYLLLLWLVGIAVISMFTALSVWLKSKSGCIAIAIVYATGLWIMLTTTILNILNIGDLMNYTLLYQISGLYTVISSLDSSSLMKLLCISGIFTVLYTSFSIYGLTKKDI